MRFSRYLLITLVLFLPIAGEAQTRSSRADRAWKPFLTTLRAAVKKHDRAGLNKLMARDFYYLSSGGDENSNNDSRDEAFEYWETAGTGAWEALDKVLAQGAVVNTAMRNPESHWPSRVAPPLANNQRAIKERSFDWYAVFEFRNGRWYFTGFTECCD